jgi:hypothetical protein
VELHEAGEVRVLARAENVALGLLPGVFV